MAENYLSASMQKLIIAVNKYRESLEHHKKILLNAADVCDCTMGSDELSKRHINELINALKSLDNAAMCAESIANHLARKEHEADEI